MLRDSLLFFESTLSSQPFISNLGCAAHHFSNSDENFVSLLVAFSRSDVNGKFNCKSSASLNLSSMESSASLPGKKSVLFIGTQFSILYTFMYSPA